MSIFIYMSIIIYQVGMAVLVKKCQVGMAEWQVGMAVFVGREGSVWLFLSVWQVGMAEWQVGIAVFVSREALVSML